MGAVWTLVKVVVGLAIAIPLAIIVLGTAIGILGALVGLAALALKLALALLIGVGCVRLLRALFRGPAPQPPQKSAHALPPVDRHYEAAMRELDLELGETRRR